jgi:SAM-dependent methyltransferase
MMSSITASKLEYIFFRLIRRYLFSSGFLERYGRSVPDYRVNYNQCNPGLIVDRYCELAARHGIAVAGRRVLELGSGATNATAYALAARGCSLVYACEPYARFDFRADEKLLAVVAKSRRVDAETITRATRRITSVSQIPERSVDAVFSFSVLEHVLQPEQVFTEIKSALVPGGVMIHCIDYRDHFFKYPFHRLLFSRKVWNRWLDPGDLPGWSLSSHRALLEKLGWTVILEEVARDTAAFEKIKVAIAADYDRNDPYLDVTTCAMVAR